MDATSHDHSGLTPRNISTENARETSARNIGANEDDGMALHHENGATSLYTPEQKARRDASIWTLVQGILAPVQFVIFLISAALVVRYLMTGAGYDAAVASILIKTAALYTIMVTGAIWEKEVFGQYLLAPAFFWEDVFSFLVIFLHTAYLVCLFAGIGSPAQQMLIALAAYGTYVINAVQFIWKLRQARLQGNLTADNSPESAPTGNLRTVSNIKNARPLHEVSA